MSHEEYTLNRIVSAAPFVLTQIGIALAFLRWAGRRSSARLLVWVIGSVELVTIVMDVFPGFWRALRPISSQLEWLRTAVYLWMFPSSAAFFIFLLYRFLAKRLSPETSPSRRRLIQTAGVAAVAAPFAAEAFGVLIGRLDFHTREVDLKVKNLHPDLEGLRILQLSDVHLGAYLSVREFARVIDASNELRPHVALMTGDLISTWGDPIDDCLAQLKRVRSDAGMFGCLGNHEAYTDTEDYATLQASELGIRFLRFEKQQLRFGNALINFGGVDYLGFTMRGRYLNGTQSLKHPGALNILLTHNPDVFSESAVRGWDITLAGHTHGGQVTLEILDQTVNPARFYTPYVSGLYQRGSALCYVTRGIGTIGIPARLGATPEITLLRLRKA